MPPVVRSKDRRLWKGERSLLLFCNLNNQACKADENQAELKQLWQSYVHGQPPFPESRKKCAGIAAPALYSPNGLPIGEQPLLTVSVVPHADYINLAGAVSIQRANISMLGENIKPLDFSSGFVVFLRRAAGPDTAKGKKEGFTAPPLRLLKQISRRNPFYENFMKHYRCYRKLKPHGTISFLL